MNNIEPVYRRDKKTRKRGAVLDRPKSKGLVRGGLKTLKQKSSNNIILKKKTARRLGCVAMEVRAQQQ